MSAKIADELNFHNRNSLNAVRLGLAYLVVFSHAFPVGGFGSSPNYRGIPLGFLSVGGFFAISGYLITRSRFRTRLGVFLWRRFLRIVPGFWVAIAVTAFVLAPLVGAINGGWNAGAALAYLVDGMNLWNAPTQIGTTLNGTPYPMSWNGSLWSIQWEVVCYVAVGILAGVGLVRRTRWLAVAALVLSTAASIWVQAAGILGPKHEFSMVLPFFLAGSVLYLYSDRIAMSWRLGVPALLALCVLPAFGQGRTLTPLCLAYVCLWIGARGPAWLRKVGHRNDLSYGVFLYGFPVEMVLAALGVAAWGFFAYASLSLLVTTVFAAASWFLVEKPAMSLKNVFRSGNHPPRSDVGAGVRPVERATGSV